MEKENEVKFSYKEGLLRCVLDRNYSLTGCAVIDSI